MSWKLGTAVQSVNDALFPGPNKNNNEILAAFESGTLAHAGEDITSAQLVQLLSDIPALKSVVEVFVGTNATPAVQASGVEFVLEGLHLSKRLNKDASGVRATYRAKA